MKNEVVHLNIKRMYRQLSVHTGIKSVHTGIMSVHTLVLGASVRKRKTATYAKLRN